MYYDVLWRFISSKLKYQYIGKSSKIPKKYFKKITELKINQNCWNIIMEQFLK
jgi:hypothetical protein